MSNLRNAIRAFLEKAEYTYMALGFVYLGLYSAQVLLQPEPGVNSALEIASETIYWLFIVDLAMRVFAKGPGILTIGGAIEFFKQNWLSIAAALLPAFRSLRVLRVLVVLRGLAPYITTRSSKVAMVVLVALPLMLYTSAISVLDAERNADGANITTFADAIWWALASVTTVGYGDRFPVTGEGRIIATLLMTVGIGLFSALTALLAAWVMAERQTKAETMSKVEKASK